MESAAEIYATEGLSDAGDHNDAELFYDGCLYEQLWHACAGPLVSLPTAGESVYYFPQGHIEQFADRLYELPLPRLNLPSKILCKVINVQRRVEPETDQVYAQITLLPEPDYQQTKVTSSVPQLQERERHTVHSFCKTLTASDLRTPGSLFIEQEHAETCFPTLDMSQLEPSQELVAIDIHGNEWRFHHICWGNPKHHVLTTGWTAFMKSKMLQAGDSLIFLRGKSERLRVGVKRCKRLRIENELSFFMPTSSVCVGVLATADYALHTGTLFTIFYKPRINQSQFIVNVGKYLEAQHHKFSIGMKFMMRFEADQVLEKSFQCTIVDIGPISQKWSDSKWRCLKVLWDAWNGLPIFPPERVSPWELEPLAAVPDHGMWIFPVEASIFPCNDLYSSSASPTTSKTNSISCSEDSSPTRISIDQSENVAESVDSVVGECSDEISDASGTSRLEFPSKNSELLEELQSNLIRTRTKVRMQGILVGRSVDLTVFTSHEELLRELEVMFEIESELSGSTKQWLVVYTDAGGEMKMVEDYPWHQFCSMVKKIFINRLV